MGCKQPQSSAKFGVSQSSDRRCWNKCPQFAEKCNIRVHLKLAFMWQQVEDEDMPKFSWKVRMRNHLCIPHPRCFPGTISSAHWVLNCVWNELKLLVAQVAGLRFRFLVPLLKPHHRETTLLFSRKTRTNSGHGASAYHCTILARGAVPTADWCTV